MILSKPLVRQPLESDWHKRFVFFGWCNINFWGSEVWARRRDAKWEFRLTDEEQDLIEEIQTW